LKKRSTIFKTENTISRTSECNNLLEYSVDSRSGVSNFFRPRATRRDYSRGEGHFVKFSLSWEGGKHQ